VPNLFTKEEIVGVVDEVLTSSLSALPVVALSQARWRQSRTHEVVCLSKAEAVPSANCTVLPSGS
jgi:hypothetical protein